MRVIEKAIQKIKTGWMQGRFMRRDAYNKPCAWCLYGALAHSTNSVRVLNEAEAAVQDVIRDKGLGYHVIDFNDAKGRTQAEVLRVLHTAKRRLLA